MTIINKKRVGARWYCFGTIDGYDHSFEGDNEYIVCWHMRQLLNKKGITDAKWEPTQYYEATKIEKFVSPINLNGIDFNPIG